MEIAEILALYDQEQRRDIEFPEARKEILPHVVRFVRPAPGANFIQFSQLDEVNADAIIQEQIDYFKPMNQPFDWKIYDYDQPPDLRDRLLRHGFEPDEPGAVMVLDLQQAPADLLRPVTADIRILTRKEQLKDVIRVEEKVWDGSFDWIYERMGAHLAIPGYLSIHTAYLDDVPVSTGWTYFYPNSAFAGLWGGSTVPAFRGQGFYTAILSTRVQEALRRGYRFLIIEAGPMSRPIVEKHGFQFLAYAEGMRWTEKNWPNGQAAVD